MPTLGIELVAVAALIVSMGCAPPDPATPNDGLAQAQDATVFVVEPSTVAASATPPAIAAADIDGARDLVGTYRYHSGKDSVRKAIDAVVAEMNVMVRRIARRRLVAANAVPQSIAIRQDGDVVTVTIDGRDYSAPLGGGSRKVRDPNGEASSMRLAMHGDVLHQTFHADQGDRINVFSARKNGGMTMAVRITSPKLPADVRYELAFAGP